MSQINRKEIIRSLGLLRDKAINGRDTSLLRQAIIDQLVNCGLCKAEYGLTKEESEQEELSGIENLELLSDGTW